MYSEREECKQLTLWNSHSSSVIEPILDNIVELFSSCWSESLEDETRAAPEHIAPIYLNYCWPCNLIKWSHKTDIIHRQCRIHRFHVKMSSDSANERLNLPVILDLAVFCVAARWLGARSGLDLLTSCLIFWISWLPLALRLSSRYAWTSKFRSSTEKNQWIIFQTISNTRSKYFESYE